MMMTRTRFLLMRQLSVLLVLGVALASAAKKPSRKISPKALRALEDNGYQYMEDLSAYQMEFGKCVRVKVPDDGDDEGNSYFYNGKYYAQYQQFASVFLCDAYSTSEDDACGVCDSSKEYVTDLATYLETTLEYAAVMCQSCQAKCRRRLEEEGDEVAYMNVDCNTCINTCQNMNFGYRDADDEDGDNNNNGNNNGAYDETMYLECQEAFQDDQGIQIYAGPQCNSEGDIIIGFYYDDECTVKSSSASMDLGFEYYTFRGIQQMCVSCNPYGNNNDNGDEDACDALYQESTHCSKGRNLNGGDDEDEMPICKTYEKAHKEKTYGHRRRNRRIFEIVIAVVIVGGLLWAFLTLSYTYFLRHRASKDKREPLTDHDHHTEPEVMVTSKNDVPPVS